jgi:glycosyltransferase involved in cell wall biosynthesis
MIVTSIIVAQLGARRRYTVPHVLHKAGILSTLFTDFSAGGIPQPFRKRLIASPAPGILKNLVARTPDLPKEKVVAFNTFGLTYAWKLRRARTQEDKIRSYLWAGREFGRLIIRHGLPDRGAVYAYNSAALELFQEAKKRNLATILDQTIAPKSFENEILSEARHRFPGWEESQLTMSDRNYARREEEEWQLADLILCGSDFVRDTLVAKGVPAARCRIVPTGGLSVRATPDKPAPIYDAKRPLRVLFVGTVSLRKGIPILCEAFQHIPGTMAECRIVGSIEVSPQRLKASTPPSISFIGPVPHSEIGTQYEWADVFCLPSLCEGSAMVTYEALTYGLPLIVTPNTGAIIQHGQEGLIVAPQNSEEVREAILKFAQDPDMVRAMSVNARICAEQTSFTAYAKRLVDAIGITSR